MKRARATLLVLLLLSVPILAKAELPSEKADAAYFDVVNKIEQIQDKHLPTTQRQLLFKQLLDQFTTGDDALFLPCKDGLFEILVEDPDFFFTEISQYPEAFAFWKEKFSLHWMKDEPSDYKELKALAIKRLQKSMERQQLILDMQKDALELIRKTPVTELD